MFVFFPDFDTLFNHMDTIQGSLEMKTLFIKDIIHQAGRFKRKHLIDLLQQYEQSMIMSERKKYRTVNMNQKPPSR